jgi:ribose transport system permease protein
MSLLRSCLAGVLLGARLDSVQPQAGVSYELDAIAAVVIGGTSLSGGTGSLVGTIIGVLIIGVLRNGLNLLGVSPFMQQVVIGLVIALAVSIEALKKK